LKRSSKIAIISGIVAVVIISVALTAHFRLSESERFEIESGEEENEKESASEVVNEIVNSLQNKPESEENKDEEENETILPSYVKIIDGVQVVTVDANGFTFTPSEIHIKAGMVKFVMVNSGVSEHELVVYEASKKEIVDKAELAEDEDTIIANILSEVEHTPAGESAESEVINIKEGSYIMGCHIPGHYEAGMKGLLYVE